jgi:hypothetical protein
MAPTPTNDMNNDNNLMADTTATPNPNVVYWTKANIAVTAVFALLALAIFIILLAFYLRRRSHKKKHANRKSDKAALLQHDDKSTMFSRERHSSVTLYIDEDTQAQGNRASQDNTSLIPLHITPGENVHDALDTTASTSNGSGVSAMSRLTTNTMSTMMLSPILPSENGDLSVRSSGGRSRSTSTSSQRARYYENTPVDVERPPVPIIVRTELD